MNDMAPIGLKLAADRAAAAQGVARRLKGIIADGRIMTDPLMTYAYSGDASSYRLMPAVVVIINTEDEVRAVIAAARAEGLPLTFRAAGTSLSGQAVTDGVLAVLGDGWRKLQIHDPGAEQITLGPAIIVANANKALKPFNKKIGPGPGQPGHLQDRRRGQQQLVRHVLRRGVEHLPHHGAAADDADRRHHAGFRRCRELGRRVPRQPCAACLRALRPAAPRGDGRCRPGGADPQEIPDQEHGRLFDQCAGRLSTTRSTS